MGKPEGRPTAVQHEILEVVWAAPGGATVTEIWEAIKMRRTVTRTTVLNLVDRLEKRGWLSRQKKKDGNFRYLGTVDRESTARMVAADVVDEFFSGSASHLVMSLLGAKRLPPDEVQKLRRLLESGKLDEPPKRGKK